MRLAEELQTYVDQQGGTGQIFGATSSHPATKARSLELFQADRAQDYYGFEGKCQAFLAEIDKEIRGRNFSYAECEKKRATFQQTGGVSTP